MRHTEKWFENRIGKRVYRHKNHCPCVHCVKVLTEGLVIHDTQHAHYLKLVQDEEGMRYFDNPA